MGKNTSDCAIRDLSSAANGDPSGGRRRRSPVGRFLGSMIALLIVWAGPATASDLIVAINNTGDHIWTPPHISGGDRRQLSKMMHDSLTQLNPETGEIEGMLAESYSVSEDGLTWRFKLRPNVQFHNGWGKLTSEDVKYSWEQWMRPDSNRSGAPQLREFLDNDLGNFEIINDLEFVIHSTSTVVDAVIAHQYNKLFITSKKYHESQANPESRYPPIGTGPWKFVGSTPGVEVIMEKNDEYWGTVPSFDRLIIKEIPDGSARLAQLRAGTVDIATLEARLTGEARAAGVRVEGSPDIGSVHIILGGMYYGHPELDRDSPWIQADNPKAGLAIREAMSLAIDRKLILDSLLFGEGILNYAPLLQFGNPELIDPSWTLPEYDPDKARAKLAEGGYPDGFSVTMPLYQDDVDTLAIGEAVAGMWEEIGLKVTRMPMEEDVLDERLEKFDSNGLAWVKLQGYDPPTLVLANYVSSEDDNYFFYPPLDEAYDKLSKAPDRATSYAIQREFMTDLRDNMIVIPLFRVNSTYIVGPKVGDWGVRTPGDKELHGLETVTPAN